MRNRLVRILIMTLFLSIVSNALAATLEERMDKIVYEKELDFKNVPLSDVLSIISKTSGITIVPEAEIGNLNIDIYFGKGQSLGEIIRTLKATNGLNSRELNSVLILGKNITGHEGMGGKIVGKVISKKTGEGIENIKIYLVGNEENATISVVGGNYILPNVDSGTYILKAEGEFYKSAGAIIELSEDETFNQDIVMNLDEKAETIVNQTIEEKGNTFNNKSLGAVTSGDGNKLSTEKVILKHAFPSEVKAVVDSVVSDVEITAVEKQNILVLKGSDGNIDTAKKLIQELDKPVKQVRITAQILEVTGNLTDNLGIDWSYSSKSDYGSNISPGKAALDTEGLSVGIVSGLLNFTDYLSSAGDIIAASINILKTTNDASIAAIPSIVTLNGEEASINVTGEQNIGTTETTDDDGNTVVEPTFKEAGTILTVTPIIRDGEDEPDTITLTINSELSSFVTDNTGSTAVGALQKNSASTKVRVQDGGVIFIGGLKRTNVTNEVKKIPLLGDIPILGRLFKSESVVNVQKDVYIQIKAEIVTVENQNDDISSDGFKNSKINLKEKIFPGKRN